MRLLWLLLCLAPVCVFADGIAASKLIGRLQETDQAAVIQLAPDGVTLDMYIAIDGIPEGKTITYILPFWHKPEGFTMAEIVPRKFHGQYIRPQKAAIEEQNDRAHRTRSQLLNNMLVVGAVGAGPAGIALTVPFSVLCVPVFSAKGRISPYATVSLPAASAELYQVPERDLLTLVRQAGLPEQYVDTLKRYQTEYFAVMRLTGTEPETADGLRIPPTGIHYHFRHAMRSEQYTYTYPLGTGAAWAKPVLLTDIYVSCAPGFFVQVDAPTYGNGLNESRTKYLQMLHQLQAARTDTAATGKLPMQTHSLMETTPGHPRAWHRCYVQANPDQDITVRFGPHPRYAQYQMLDWFTRQNWIFTLIEILAMVAAWWVAVVAVLRRRWITAGREGTFLPHVLRLVRHITGLWAILSGAALIFVPVFALTGEARITALFAYLPLCCYLTAFVWSRRVDDDYVPIPPYLGRPYAYSYVVALSTFIVINIVLLLAAGVVDGMMS